MSKTVLFVAAPEWNAFIYMMPVAKKLAEQGFQIIFASIRGNVEITNPNQFNDYKEYVFRNGFIFESLEFDTPKPQDWIAKAQYDVNLTKTAYQRLLELIDIYEVNLVLVEVLASIMALAAIEKKVPVKILANQIDGYPNLRVPPAGSYVIPGPGLLKKVIIGGEWLKLKLFFVLVFLSPPGLVYLWLLYINFFYPKAKTLGVKLLFGEYFYRVDLPTFYLVPRKLDFDGLLGHNYIGLTIGVSPYNSNQTFKLNKLTGNKPLIYCSLGTYASTYKYSKRFYQVMIETFNELPEYELLLNLGKNYSSYDIGPLPENVELCQFVPQLEVLEKAVLMICQGGMNTIKECIYYQVPLLVFPGHSDQPSNSARVVNQGIGLRGKLANISAKKLGMMITELLTNPSYGHNIAKLKEICQQEDRQPEFIEELIRLANQDNS